MKKIISKCCLFFCMLMFGMLFLSSARAQTNRSYSYDLIDVDIKVNEDSTLDVTERQTFNFVGAFHEAWRTIPFNKISGVSNIQVFDGESGQPLAYVGGKRDKLAPSSWNKFTYNKENGAENIIWYYDQADASHSWVLKYKIHGAVTFGQTADRLYWNIFTDYSVPVAEAKVRVTLPRPASKADVKVFAYRSSGQPVTSVFESGSVVYSASGFAPKEAFTVDLGFSSGQVSQNAFWLDFARTYYGYLGSALLLLACFWIGLIYWYRTEGSKTGRGTIIPQYEPPQQLRPAMAEVIVKEAIGNKGLVATIVDLAVRGYVKIEEEPSKYFVGVRQTLEKHRARLAALIIVILTLLVAIFFSLGEAWPLIFMPLAGLLVVLFIALFSGRNDYVVRSLKPYKDDAGLEDYEKAYLDLLLDQEGKFSTRALRHAGKSTKSQFSAKLQKLKELICSETETDTKSFERSINKEKYIGYFFMAVAIGFFFILKLEAYSLFASQSFVLVIGAVIGIGGLIIFVLFESRLSEQGRILKEEWLGFKLYLEVAEKYRLQNLTPELFEKYLPYAIVFGVEKKWAKAFEALSLAAPVWYAGHSYYSGSGGQASDFSPSGFSASFTSSFASAFASSGASGGAGGGSAGGGGGGGGGGAS